VCPVLPALPIPGGPRVLVVDENAAARAQLGAMGREKLLAVVAVGTPAEALDEAARGHFEAAIIDASLEPQALALVQGLRATPGHERLPLAFLSPYDGVDHRVAAAHAGASLFLTKPVDAYAFDAAIDQMIALGQGERMRVLVVDDDPDFVGVLTAVLEREGILVRAMPDATRLVEMLEEVRPDLILLDAMLPHVSGWDAIRIVRTSPEHRDVPILFLTGRTDLASRVAAFDAGADDYLGKPLVVEELLARVRVRLDRRRLLQEITERDALTRLLSRRALLDGLASRLSEARRHVRLLSVALLDIDRFKSVNDSYGHLVGDHVLVALGRLLGARFRLEDLRGRFGGEEFAIVFPGATPQTAEGVLSRVLDELREMPFSSEKGERFFVSFSGGVSGFPGDGSSVDGLLRAADRRLYEAKGRGRGCIVGP
jgi:diguanylate cyclase (GGDEF)-like protein